MTKIKMTEKEELKTNLSISRNPVGQINTKLNGRIFDETAELIQNRTPEFNERVEYCYTYYSSYRIYQNLI